MQVSQEQSEAEENLCRWVKELALMGVNRETIISQIDETVAELIREQLNFESVEEGEKFLACSLQKGQFVVLPNNDALEVTKVYPPNDGLVEMIGSDGLHRKFPVDFPLNVI